MQLLSSLVSTSQSAHAPSFPRRLCLVRHYLIPSLRRKADPLSCKGCRGAAVRVLCFHNLTNCFSRKPLLLITIRIAPGVGIPVVLYLATRHSPLPLYFHQLADSLTLFGLFFESSQFVFSNLRTLFAKHRGGYPRAQPQLSNCQFPTILTPCGAPASGQSSPRAMPAPRKPRSLPAATALRRPIA